MVKSGKVGKKGRKKGESKIVTGRGDSKKG